MSEETEKDLRLKLSVSGNYSTPYPKESILAYGNICQHDSGYLCEHRLNWLINYIKDIQI